MGQKSQLKPGEFVDADDIDFGSDEATQTAATGIINRNRKWMADHKKQADQRQVSTEREMFELETRGLTGIYGHSRIDQALIG